MKAPAALVATLMARARRDFYQGERATLWFAQQKMVKRAILYPARWLKDRAVPISGERYEEIVAGILDTAKRHGDLRGVKYMSRYLLHCVQEHMEHQGDAYYAEGKAIRNRVDVFMGGVEKARRAPDMTIDVLAEAEALLAQGKRQPKPKAEPLHDDLFGPVKPRRVAKSN